MLKTAAYRALDPCTASPGAPRPSGGRVIRSAAPSSPADEADYEPETFRFLARHCHAGDTSLDIGAHLDLHEVFAAQLVGSRGPDVSVTPSSLTDAHVRNGPTGHLPRAPSRGAPGSWCRPLRDQNGSTQ